MLKKIATGYRRILRTSADQLPEGGILPVCSAHLIMDFCELRFYGGRPSFKKRRYNEVDASIFKDVGRGTELRHDALGYAIADHPEPLDLKEEMIALGDGLLGGEKFVEGFVISPGVAIAKIPPEVPTRDLAFYLALYMHVLRNSDRIVASDTGGNSATVHLDYIEGALLRFLDMKLEEDGIRLDDLKDGILADMGRLPSSADEVRISE